MAEMGLFETIRTARALRHLKPDPVPDDVIAKVMDAAVRAPTGSNLAELEVRGDQGGRALPPGGRPVPRFDADRPEHP